jgi:ABC-type antimicrobial peptide transport system permease subunit
MILPTLLPIVIIFLSFTFLGFYFVIRSSMISRIQEIGIYRALGVKRLEIISMFFFEIIVLTTVSTLIGYLLGFRLVKLLSSGILGLLNVFGINAFSFMLGLIAVYAFNLFAGLLPVFGLLRKTPAQILTQYDI